MTSSGNVHLDRHRCVACREVASNVGENFVTGFLYGVYRPGEWVWVDSNSKMETRYPADHLAMYFRQYKVTAYSYDSLKLQGIKKSCFCVFLWKTTPLRRNCQNSVPKRFIATPIDVLCSKFVKFGLRKIGKSCVIYLTKNKFRLALPLLLLRGSRVPDFIQIGSLSVELYPNAWTWSKLALNSQIALR